LEKDGAQLVIVNGLGASIQSLWLADHDGRIHTAANVVAGQRAVLSASGESVSAQTGVSVLLERLSYSPWGHGGSNEIATSLVPGSYFAELESNPFVENGLGERASSARLRSLALVFGLLEPDTLP
jgi:hypothetical protein